MSQRKGTGILMERAAPKHVSAYKLRYQEGLTYREVAEKLDYASEGAAYNAVQAGMLYITERRSEEVEQARNKAIVRIKQMIMDLYERLGKPTKTMILDKDQKIKQIIVDDKGDLEIYDKILKLEQHLSKLEGTVQDQYNTAIQINNNSNGATSHEEALKLLE